MWIKTNSSRFAKGAPNTMEFFWGRLDQQALNEDLAEQEWEVELTGDPGVWWDSLPTEERIRTRWGWAASRVMTLADATSQRGIAEVWS